VIYDYREIKGKVSWQNFRKRNFSHWRYREFFPAFSDKGIVSLGEGGTPQTFSRFIGKTAGLRLVFKNETVNPTGSFKDRGTSVEISRALELGIRHVDCASTGNMGASVAAYCAAAGIRAKVFVPRKTAHEKIAHMLAHEAELVIRGRDYNAALALAERDYRLYKTYLMGDYPYRGEGEKSISFEIVDSALANGYFPNYIALPMGNGTLCRAVWKGLKELKGVGLIKRLPKILGFQAERCAPIVNSFKAGAEHIDPVRPKTLAAAIAVGNPLDGLPALDALRESKGVAEAVSDGEILRAQKLLALREGIWAEPSGAVALAGILKLLKMGHLSRNDSVVCLITGHGLKEPRFY